jgi:hypothetical protein
MSTELEIQAKEIAKFSQEAFDGYLKNDAPDMSGVRRQPFKGLFTVKGLKNDIGLAGHFFIQVHIRTYHPNRGMWSVISFGCAKNGFDWEPWNEEQVLERLRKAGYKEDGTHGNSV